MDASNLPLPEERNIPELFNIVAAGVEKINAVLEFADEPYRFQFNCDEPKACLFRMSDTGKGDNRLLMEIEKTPFDLWRIAAFPAFPLPDVESETTKDKLETRDYTGLQAYEFLQKQLMNAFDSRLAEILQLTQPSQPLQSFPGEVIGGFLAKPVYRMQAEVQKSIDFINEKLGAIPAFFHFEQLVKGDEIFVFKMEKGRSGIRFDDVATISLGSAKLFNFKVAPLATDNATPSVPYLGGMDSMILMLENRMEAFVDAKTKDRTGVIFDHAQPRSQPTWAHFLKPQ